MLCLGNAQKKRKVDTDSNRKKYKTEVRAKHATPFVLRDDSGGEIEVNPENASLSFDEVAYSVEYGDEVADEARQRVRNLPADEIRVTGRQSEEEMEPDDLLTPTNPKYEEYALIPGDEVHVYGAEAQAPTNRSRQAELIGDDFYTITEGDESAAIKKKLLGAVITCLLGLPVLGFSLFVIYGGIMNILEIIYRIHTWILWQLVVRMRVSPAAATLPTIGGLLGGAIRSAVSKQLYVTVNSRGTV